MSALENLSAKGRVRVMNPRSMARINKPRIPTNKEMIIKKHHQHKSGPVIAESKYERVPETTKKENFEIFAYCSKNYEDAYKFVINSYTKPENVTKVTIYTDWDLKSDNPKVEIKHMFEPSSSWIVGTGRRLDVIKDYSELNRGQAKNVLFLDIDCYLVKDVSEIFRRPDYDIAITRLFSGQRYANKTATAGLWFAKLTPGYYNFIEDWFQRAAILKSNGYGVTDHRISYVQYSFTDVARTATNRYSVLPIDEKVYNSEHSDEREWYKMIREHKPKILHYKGRRFRNKNIVDLSLSLAGGKI